MGKKVKNESKYRLNAAKKAEILGLVSNMLLPGLLIPI